jgi:myo-inositol 2-dehydrogenase/D-chiro-inositol 1-dehydrogenase
MTRFAMIGAGRIARAHAKSFQAIDDAELVWVTDPVQEAVESLAALTGAKAAADPSEALADPSVDALLICSPTPTHVELIRAGVAAGKAVLCEKPIDLSLERANELAADLAGSGARVMMGFNRRFDPSFAAINARVVAGEIGKIEQVVIISRDPAPPPPAYVAASGGIFKDMTIHDFDMARFFLPDIVEVEAVGQNVIDPGIEEAGDYDGAIVTLRASSGALATIVNSRRCTFGYDQRLEVFGELGMLQAENLLPNSVRSYGTDHAERTAPYLHFFLERYAAAYAAELKAFVDALNSGAEFSPSLEDGRAALELAVAADESARTGRRVAVRAG